MAMGQEEHFRRRSRIDTDLGNGSRHDLTTTRYVSGKYLKLVERLGSHGIAS